MSAISAVFYRESKIRMTNLTFVFWDLFFPLMQLLLFGIGMSALMGSIGGIFGPGYSSFFLAGVLAMASFSIAGNSSWSFFTDRDNGIFYEMLTYPMSRTQFLAGKLLLNVVLAWLQAVITVGAACWLLGIRILIMRVPLLAFGVALGEAGWFFFYTIFALKIRRNDLFNSVTSLLYFLFLFVSSMFYPLDPLPHWFRAIARCNPLTWQVDLYRFATIGTGAPRTIAFEVAAFALFSLVMFGLAVRSLQEQG
jgi:ABC-2 type transport system permease protein